MDKWWQHTVFYEIYIMSFCDGNGDGIGDLQGIIAKLPYLKKLGVGGIWLTPFYPSPKVDNGYDISDYCNVDPEYGTMDDFERLIKKAHELDIRVIADMVVNHTSTRHPWFMESSSSPDNPKRDWYLWKESNNWESFFGGSAWELDPCSGQYYYHSFAKEQADLNWRNPEVEEAIGGILDFWLDKGIDGFRFDVINNLTVSEELRDNPLKPTGEQLHKYDVNQPGIHQMIRRICGRVREKNPDIFLVGEISSDELDIIHSYVDCDGLDTTFNFNLGSRERFCFHEILAEMKKMEAAYNLEQLSTVFFGSHDMRRFPDRFSFSEGRVKCLLTLMLVWRGIPFLYFGDELGMRSRILSSVEEAKDIQGIMAYTMALEQGKSKSEAIRVLNEKSRDASRNHMQWETVRRQSEDPFSILNFTQNLIGIRKTKEIFVMGNMRLREIKSEVMEIERVLAGQRVTAILNFSECDVTLSAEYSFRILLASGKTGDGIMGQEIFISAGESVILEHMDDEAADAGEGMI